MPRKKSDVQDVIRARRIELVDSKGTVRMLCEITRPDEDCTNVHLYDGDGKERLWFRAIGKAPHGHGQLGEIVNFYKEGKNAELRNVPWQLVMSERERRKRQQS